MWNEKALKMSNKKAKLDKFDLEAEREAKAIRSITAMVPKKTHIDGRKGT